MKKLMLAASACALMAGAANAEDVKIGILIGFTGPIESLTGHMANAAEAAMAEVNASGKAKNTYIPVRGDDTCTDAAAATAATERAVTAEGVKGIIGGDCSGVTRAMLTNVAMPNGIVMVSPSATSPALTNDPVRLPVRAIAWVAASTSSTSTPSKTPSSSGHALSVAMPSRPIRPRCSG